MIDFIATYLFIGMIFVFAMEWATSHARKKGIPVPPNADFDTESKLIAIAIWPIGLLYFLLGYIKERFFRD